MIIITMFNVYNNMGKAISINVYYKNGRYEIRADQEFIATVECRYQIDEEIIDFIKAENLSFVNNEIFDFIKIESEDNKE